MTGDPETAANQRLIEEDAASLYEEAPCGYLYSRPDGTLVRVNQTFLDWTGFSREELIGRRFQDLLTVGGRIFHETHFAPLLHMQGAVTEMAFDVVTKTGKPLPVFVNSVQKRDTGGTPLLHRTTIFNATDRKKYERELQMARQRAEESARAKSELLSTISHDMRSPLGAILAAAQLLGTSQLSAAQQNYVRVLRSSSEGLLQLVNNVLDLNRIESGQATLERRPFDLRQLVFDVMAALNVRAGEKQLALLGRIDAAVPASVIGDPVKMGQILTNLVANAVKFTERGSVEIAIQVAGMTDTQTELEFRVADTGIGIPPDRLPHIFEAFTQASYDVEATYGGSGLGLAIVRRLIALLDSEIRVQSVVDQGSVFSFSLAFGVVAESGLPGRDIGRDGAIAESQLIADVRVLLVEDNSFDAEVVGRALTSWGITHDLAPTIADASDKARSTGYDVVLLSSRLVEGDADGTARRLFAGSNRGTARPRVLLLARSSGEAAGIKTAGAIDDVIHKPVDPSVLYAKLASVRR